MSMEAIDIWAVLAMSIGLIELAYFVALLVCSDRKPF
jgi:hypothetical protein